MVEIYFVRGSNGRQVMENDVPVEVSIVRVLDFLGICSNRQRGH